MIPQKNPIYSTRCLISHFKTRKVYLHSVNWFSYAKSHSSLDAWLHTAIIPRLHTSTLMYVSRTTATPHNYLRVLQVLFVSLVQWTCSILVRLLDVFSLSSRYRSCCFILCNKQVLRQGMMAKCRRNLRSHFYSTASCSAYMQQISTEHPNVHCPKLEQKHHLPYMTDHTQLKYRTTIRIQIRCYRKPIGNWELYFRFKELLFHEYYLLVAIFTEVLRDQGIVFARGPAVAVSILLESKGHTYAVVTEQVRVPVGKFILELPAGMLDDEKVYFVGNAVLEVEEETVIRLNLEDMVDITALLDPATGCRMFSSLEDLLLLC